VDIRNDIRNRQLVLAAIDHGTDARRVLAVARRIAKARGADLDVLRVSPHRAVYFDDRPGVRPVESQYDARLASLLRSGEGLDVRSVTLRGTPEHVIPAYSQLRQGSLLVLQRDYGSSWFWRNSRVVDDLARQSPIPLLVLPTPTKSEEGESGLRRILAPIDDSIASTVALRTVADLSRRYSAQVTVVHALNNVPREMVLSGSEAWAVAQQLPAQIDAAAERFRRKAVSLGVNDIDTKVATGDVGHIVREMAERTDPDLIVMGIADRSWLGRLMFGSTLRRVLRRSTAPVLVVPVVAGRHTSPRTSPGAEQRVG